MAETVVTGDIGRKMAANPLQPGQQGNPILATLGRPAFMPGDGRKYDRTTGFGNNKVKNPQGGTNETIAWVVFHPFKGSDLTVEGRIYCERFVEDGKSKRVYSISLPFLKAERRDVASRELIESAKLVIREDYRAWTAKDGSKAKAAKPTSSGQWSESDEDTATA